MKPWSTWTWTQLERSIKENSEHTVILDLPQPVDLEHMQWFCTLGLQSLHKREFVFLSKPNWRTLKTHQKIVNPLQIPMNSDCANCKVAPPSFAYRGGPGWGFWRKQVTDSGKCGSITTLCSFSCWNLMKLLDAYTILYLFSSLVRKKKKQTVFNWS